jgi:hypothetical protein
VRKSIAARITTLACAPAKAGKATEATASSSARSSAAQTASRSLCTSSSSPGRGTTVVMTNLQRTLPPLVAVAVPTGPPLLRGLTIASIFSDVRSARMSSMFTGRS